MDEEILGMIRDNFARLHETCQGIRDDQAAHVAKDELFYDDVRSLNHRVTSYERMVKAAAGLAGLVGVDKIWHWLKP